MKFKIQFLLFLFSITLFSQELNFTTQEVPINVYIDGTLLIPNAIEKPNLVIIIAGSGPTDRNGNQNFAKNNSLKKLAQGLSNSGIATFRYDKRVVKQIKKRNVDPNILFDDFVTDAISVLKYFKTENKYNKIYIAGHSQGSLIGMLSAKEGADGYISIAGAGNTIDMIILDQISSSAPVFTKDSKRIFSILKEGKTTDDYPPPLASIFNKDIQLFMANWMQYNPQEEIKKLNMPILIINGTKDLQVPIEEANLLKNANPDSEFLIIENMNHVLVPIKGNDNLENSKSYNEPLRALSPELIEGIIKFVK
ncbi:alpha/beta hydrolase [Flavobacteriaceae bacterium AU392]|nr:alpha/beta hydrolase [Flavobacteriaceae bacterium]RKM81133.1 alpha/beta hydrolase [Flavobacteriaceae bacterium AU392]